MNVQNAIDETLACLSAVGRRDWNVMVIETFRGKDENLRGAASMLDKCIVLSGKFIDDDAEMRRVIEHECAHAICEGDMCEAAEHGDNFQDALERVQRVRRSASLEASRERAASALLEQHQQAQRHAEESRLAIHEQVAEIMSATEARLADERRSAAEEQAAREDRQYLVDTAIKNNERADLLRSRLEVRKALDKMEKRNG